MSNSSKIETFVAQSIFERLENSGVDKSCLDKIKMKYWEPDSLDELDVWSRQYLSRGRIWGNEPSICGTTLLTQLDENDRVLEVGCGYGRDTKFFVDNKLLVTAIDNSDFAVWETMQQIKESVNDNHKSSVSFGDIKTLSLPKNHFDAASSHRVLHLVTADELTVILNRISASLKSKGIIALTLREPNDFNANSMEKTGAHSAKYKDKARKGHVINFYDEERLGSLLSHQFTDLSYSLIEEPESIDSFDNNAQRMTKLIVVTGRKKTDEELGQLTI